MANQERLSGADNAWRRMGTSTNLTTITGLLTFPEQIRYEEIRDILEERLLRFDRFTQRVGGRKRTVRRPYWEPADSFDIDAHIHKAGLPEPGGREQLMEFVGTVMARPLSERRPPWEVYHFDEYEAGSAIVVRLHHSLADGFALLYVLFGLTDSQIEHAADQTATTTDESTSAASNPSSDRGLIDQLKLAGTAAKSGLDLLTMADEAETSLRGDLGTEKRAAWTEPLDIEPIKEVGTAYDATINDVLLAATAGVFRRELDSRGEATTG